MNTKQLFAGLLLAGGILTGNAQNAIDSSTLTSGGFHSGINGSNSTYYGVFTGNLAETTSSGNTLIGYYSGKSVTSGAGNVFIGTKAGYSGSTAFSNVFLGGNAGFEITTSGWNTFIGNYAGNRCQTASKNVFLGYYSGANTSSTTYNNGASNTYLGYYSGCNNVGSRNVFLGYQAGYGSTGSDLLFIENTNSATPLIWGDFANDLLKFNGKVGIGMLATAFPTGSAGVDVSNYKLFVKGGILANEVRVETTWADYVFEDTYALRPLEEVECYIEENGHLPNMLSAKQVEENGIELGEMAKIQQEKIEELTLYIIKQNKQLQQKQKAMEKLEAQQKELDELKALVQQLAAKKQ